MLYNKRHLCVRHAASTDPNRVNLNGVHFEPDGKVIGTDGHILAIVEAAQIAPRHADDTALKAFTLPLDAAIRLERAIPKGRETRSRPILGNAQLDVEHTNENGVVRFRTTTLGSVQVHDARKVDGEFPRWGQVIPDESSLREPVGFDADLLARACKIAKEFAKAAGMRKPWVKVRLNSDPRCAAKLTVESPDGDTLTMIVMPSRV